MLSLPQLESHLWQAAQLLRGSVDSGDFKHYILALLFYKRLCDVWDEAQASSRASYEISQGYHWADLRTKKPGLGRALNQALAHIERCNPGLNGVFRGVDFGDTMRFSDGLLARLMEHFELHPLGHANVQADVLGQAYEYLIAKFADDAGKKGGEFYTPSTVAALMVECLAPEPGMSVYDPTCGSGGMLLQALHYLTSKGQSGSSLRIYGQEKNLNTWAICKMNMLLHGLPEADIRVGDTLHEPAHLKTKEPPTLQRFDRVIANPPFSLKAWGAKRWSPQDPYQRDRYGCPPASAGDFAFVQHMLASLDRDAVMAAVLPCGVLFREKAEGQIRRKLIEADKIEAVIALPNNLFYGTGIPACILIARRHKPQARSSKIRMIDARSFVIPAGKRDELSVAGIQRVAALYHDWSLVDERARVVTLEEVAIHSYNLTVQRYVQQIPQSTKDASLAELDALVQAREARDQAESLLLEDLSRLGY